MEKAQKAFMKGKYLMQEQIKSLLKVGNMELQSHNEKPNYLQL